MNSKLIQIGFLTLGLMIAAPAGAREINGRLADFVPAQVAAEFYLTSANPDDFSKKIQAYIASHAHTPETIVREPASVAEAPVVVTATPEAEVKTVPVAAPVTVAPKTELKPQAAPVAATIQSTIVKSLVKVVSSIMGMNKKAPLQENQNVELASVGL